MALFSEMDNSIADRSTSDATSQRPRKRMRKGTRSCTECRRRKVRCIFAAGSSVCTRCSARASECIDQREDVGPEDTVEHRLHPRSLTSPRRRRNVFSRPSNQLEHHTHISDEDLSDVENPCDSRPPLFSILDNVEDSRPATGALPSTNSASSPILMTGRQGKICEALRSALPSYDEITATLASNGTWWDSFRQKTRAILQAEPVEPLLSFAAHAYTSTNPAEVATLAVAFGRSLGRNHRLFTIVDSLIISDTPLTATLGGMECLVLLAKTYTDIGQPRRAWLTWRKGLAIAQLMGLHRAGPGMHVIRQRLWLAIYHGDRFTSLLLGLPHGFNDGFSGELALGDVDPGPLESWLPEFIHHCAVIAGQVIEHILSPSKPSFAKAMDLDERMDSIYASAPDGWWDLPTHLSGNRTELNLVVERLLIHFFFFHVRMYIHLPFLKPDLRSLSYDVSKLACTTAARQILKRYLVLRTDVDGASLFDCKTSDFVSFTAAVALQLGLCGSHKVPSVPASTDTQLLRDVESVYWNLERGSGCTIASQCRKAMTLLLGPLEEGTLEQEIPIPYFGSVVRRRVVQSPQEWEDDHEINSRFQPTPSDTTSALAFDATTDHPTGFSTDYMGYQVWDFPTGEVRPGGGSSTGVLNPFPNFDLDLVGFDIDQDWSLLFPPNPS